MVLKSTIHKQKKEVFAFSSISQCLSPFPPTFPKTMPRCLKSNTVKYSKGTRRSNSSPRKLKRNNQEDTTEMSELRWCVLTLVRDICMLGKITQCTTQDEQRIYFCFFFTNNNPFIVTPLSVLDTSLLSSSTNSIPTPTLWP